MARLSVKVDHVATLREARRASFPEPFLAAALAEMSGADSVTVHLRGDRRHIKERDLEMLRQSVKSRLNIEMAATQEMAKIALHIKPNQVTLVPERPDEITTEGGIDALTRIRDTALKGVITQLRESDIRVGLLIEPDVRQVEAAKKLDANLVELNAARYCDAKFEVDKFHAFNNIVTAAKAADKHKMEVAIGHGLTYHNVKELHVIQEIEEFVVGHAVVSRALLVGFERAVREMAELVK